MPAIRSPARATSPSKMRWPYTSTIRALRRTTSAASSPRATRMRRGRSMAVEFPPLYGEPCAGALRKVRGSDDGRDGRAAEHPVGDDQQAAGDELEVLERTMPRLDGGDSKTSSGDAARAPLVA